MKLQAKFNLAMLAAFIVGLGLAAVFAFFTANEIARREVLQQAALIASEGEGASHYTDQSVAPLLVKAGGFMPEEIPFLAAQAQFRLVQKDWPDYSYKDAALNPTDPADLAQPWEADIINRFKADPTLKQIVSERDTPNGPILSLSTPVQVSDPGCLQCHSAPAAAPPGLVARFGSTGGFGWRQGDVIAAQIVSVPMRVPLDRARGSFLVFVAGLALVFVLTLAVLNFVLRVVVVRPTSRIAAVADEVSLGRMDIPEYTPKGKDEIATVAAAFNRMRRSLANAMRLLDD